MGVRAIVVAVAAGVLLAAGCSSEAEPAARDLTVNIEAYTRLGSCMQSPIVGTDLLVVRNAEGTIVASEEIPFRPGVDEGCNWKVTVPGVPASDFYTLESGDRPGRAFVTLPAAAVETGTVDLYVDFEGDVSVEN